MGPRTISDGDWSRPTLAPPGNMTERSVLGAGWHFHYSSNLSVLAAVYSLLQSVVSRPRFDSPTARGIELPSKARAVRPYMQGGTW